MNWMARLGGAVLAGAVAQGAVAETARAQTETGGLNRETLENVAPKTAKPDSRVSVRSKGIEPGPCPLTSSDLVTTINHVEFTGPGGAALSPRLLDLLAGIAPPAGPQPISVVCTLRDEAFARLRIARFLASVQVPRQKITDGVLRLEVVTARIAEVHVRGNAGPYEGLLRSRIAALQALDPLSESEAEHVLLLADDIPGLSVKLALSPAGGRQGDLIGDLAVEYHPVTVVANVQNYNPSFLGRETGLLHAEFYGLTGMGDRTTLTGQSTFDARQVIGQATHSMLLNNAGLTLAFSGTFARTKPLLDSLDLRTTSVLAGVELSRPLVRTVNFNLGVAVGFSWSYQRSRVYFDGSSSALSRDRISQVYARVYGDWHKLSDRGYQIASLNGQLEMRNGIDILGATKAQSMVDGYQPSRYYGSSIASILRGELEGTVSSPFGPELAVRLRGQTANRALLNVDEFAIGNLTMGRGYDPGANTGDRAIGITFEPRFNFDLKNIGRVQLFGYRDVVHLWNLDQGTTEKNRVLGSLGGGLRLFLKGGLRADVTYTHAEDLPLLTGVLAKRPGDRVMFSLTAQLLPFGF